MVKSHLSEKLSLNSFDVYMSHLYAAIAKTKHVTESSLVKDTKSCFKYSDAILHTFHETTKQISFDSKLLPVTKVQFCLIYKVK